MSEAFLGEIRMFAGTFAPLGWAMCDGSLLPIATNDALYSLLGTTYGGDGQTTFGLPDLRGRIALHNNSNFPIGARGGSETVTLTSAELPSHTHVVQCKIGTGTAANPTGNFPAGNKLNADNTPFDKIYADSGGDTMLATAVTPAGGSSPHNNLQPYLVVNFIIATEGLWPPQN
jgi:microcystin-dependent protein